MMKNERAQPWPIAAADSGHDACQPEIGQANDRSRAPMVRGQGTFFDEWIDMRDPEGSALTARVLEIYDTVRPRQRKRWRDALTLRIRKLLANGLWGAFFRDPSAVLYYATKSDTSVYENNSSWMQHGALADVVLALRDGGLVQRIPGKKMPHWSATPSWASSYAPTDYLMHLAEEYGVTENSIETRIPSEDLIWLSGPKITEFKDGAIHKTEGKHIRFAPTDETQEWTATLEAINSFYSRQQITLGMSPAELAEWLAAYNANPERTEAPYRLPEVFAKAIYRVFNNGDEANPTFIEGGRMFGGWWMLVPEELRTTITINGQATVEWDYKNCHPRMLYHELPLDPGGDLYLIPEITAYEDAAGLKPETYRPHVKWLMSVLLNSKGRPATAEPPAHIEFPPDLTIKDCIGFIVASHQPIADAFGTGAGLRLMRQESDIAMEVVTTAMAEGWVVLSVHDSFITTVDKQDRLRSLMVESYLKRLGMEPEIE